MVAHGDVTSLRDQDRNRVTRGKRLIDRVIKLFVQALLAVLGQIAISCVLHRLPLVLLGFAHLVRQRSLHLFGCLGNAVPKVPFPTTSLVRTRAPRMRSCPLKEKGLPGLCGPYAIVNALGSILPLPPAQAARRRLAHLIASELSISLPSLKRDGTDRPQLLAMLAAAQSLMSASNFGRWNWMERHPRRGQSGSAFWANLKVDLAEATAVAIIGFGDYHTQSSYYEPHWTCVDRITGAWAQCLDSDVYDRVRTADTGIRPESGWEIEDCFILSAQQSPHTPKQ